VHKEVPVGSLLTQSCMILSNTLFPHKVHWGAGMLLAHRQEFLWLVLALYRSSLELAMVFNACASAPNLCRQGLLALWPQQIRQNHCIQLTATVGDAWNE
jgi:hypothetical protein